MHLLRYTEWDGTQRIRLSADKVFEKLAEYLSYTDDVQQAFDWLLRHGLELDGLQIMGVDDFLEALRDALRERQRQFNLERALDPIAERLEELLDLERATLEQREDDDARAEFERLLEELENVRALEDFQQRYGELFRGPQALDYDAALELMRE